MNPAKNSSELRQALGELQPYFKRAAWLSVVASLLVLAPSAYMLEVYDRVVNSRSHMTLARLTLPLTLTLTGCLDEDLLRELFPEAPSSSAPSAQVPSVSPPGEPVPSVASPGAPAQAPHAADPVLARLAQKPLRYTQHGRCRMACRHITEAEVEALLEDGHIAPDRTRTDGECVSYAVEGHTDDGQEVRIVYADCDRETRVVTTIDLGRDWPCECR